MGKNQKYDKSVYQCFALVTQFGITMLVPIFLCSFLGWYLDNKFQTSYLFVLLFFIGALAGFRNIFILAKKYGQSSREDDYETARRQIEKEREGHDKKGE